MGKLADLLILAVSVDRQHGIHGSRVQRAPLLVGQAGVCDFLSQGVAKDVLAPRSRRPGTGTQRSADHGDGYRAPRGRRAIRRPAPRRVPASLRPRPRATVRRDRPEAGNARGQYLLHRARNHDPVEGVGQPVGAMLAPKRSSLAQGTYDLLDEERVPVRPLDEPRGGARRATRRPPAAHRPGGRRSLPERLHPELGVEAPRGPTVLVLGPIG